MPWYIVKKIDAHNLVSFMLTQSINIENVIFALIVSYIKCKYTYGLIY